MKDKYFFDTNILIYTFDGSDFEKRSRAVGLIESTMREGTGCISYQVVQESLNVLINKLHATTAQAHQFLEDVLVALWLVNPTERLYRVGLNLTRRYKFSYYDSLIVAAALDARCNTLYSEDLQDNQKIESLTIINPFRPTIHRDVLPDKEEID